MKLLLHADDETVHVRVDINSYTLPPGEPVEIENDHHANLILEQKGFHGTVEVPMTKTRAGITYDIESATAAAKAALLAADDLVVAQYIRTQLEDRLGAGKPALAPQGRALKIIRRTKTDLADYGITPVGWKQSEAPGRGGAAGRAASMLDDRRPKSAREKQLEEQLAESNRRLAEIGLERLGDRGKAPDDVQAALEQQRGVQEDTEPLEQEPEGEEPAEQTEEQAGEAAAAAVEHGEGGLPIAPRAATLASQRNRNRAGRR